MRRRVASPHVSGAGSSVGLVARPPSRSPPPQARDCARSIRLRSSSWSASQSGSWCSASSSGDVTRCTAPSTSTSASTTNRSWLLSRGHAFTTVRGLPVFGHHATFGYFLLVPFYWLGAGPQFLDLLQVTVLALGAVPDLPLGARSPRESVGRGRTGDRVAAAAGRAVVRVGDLPPRGRRHPVPVLCGYLAAERQRIGWYWIWLALAHRVEGGPRPPLHRAGPPPLVAQGGSDSARRRSGSAAVWFVAFALGDGAAAAGGRTVYGPLYGDLGDTPAEVVGTAVEDPGAIAVRLRYNGAPSYAVQLMAPMAFTPLAAPGLLLLGAPQAVVNLLSTVNFTWDVRYHYAALPVVALALGMVEGISAIDRWARRRALMRALAVRRGVLGLTLAAALYATWAWGPSPVSMRYEDGYWPRGRTVSTDAKDAAVAAIPDGAAVSADYNLVPHLADRELIYTFPNPWISSNYGVDGRGLPIRHGGVDRPRHQPAGSRESHAVRPAVRGRRVPGGVLRRRNHRRPAGAPSRREPDTLRQTIPLVFAAISGTSWITSQCSTSLPFSQPEYVHRHHTAVAGCTRGVHVQRRRGRPRPSCVHLGRELRELGVAGHGRKPRDRRGRRRSAGLCCV